MIRWTRRSLMALAVVALPLVGTPTLASAETVLRVIPHADLKNLDPIWTTAYMSRNYGYMVYDTLFAMDSRASMDRLGLCPLSLLTLALFCSSSSCSLSCRSNRSTVSGVLCNVDDGAASAASPITSSSVGRGEEARGCASMATARNHSG